MPLWFPVTLVAVAAVLLVLRLLVPGLPIAALARPIRGSDAAMAGIGIFGLFFHCAAMFVQRVSELPGARRVVAIINDLGPGSLALFVAPAVLLLIGLKGQRSLAWVTLAVSLSTVGVTMYDHGPLATHLTTIFITVLLLSVTGTLLVSGLPPKGASRGSNRTA